MTTEYSPEFDFGTSRNNLQHIAETRVEIPPQALYEGILDVLASRGGGRWKQLDELTLFTQAGILVYVGYNELLSAITDQQVAGITTQDTDSTLSSYEVRRWLESETLLHELYEMNLDNLEVNPVSNFGNLAPARLYGILAAAHLHTPKAVQ